MNPSGPSDLHTLGYAEQRDEEAIACMTREFNSLAVIFEMPSNTFIEDQRQLVRTSMYYILLNENFSTKFIYMFFSFSC